MKRDIASIDNTIARRATLVVAFVPSIIALIVIDLLIAAIEFGIKIKGDVKFVWNAAKRAW